MTAVSTIARPAGDREILARAVVAGLALLTAVVAFLSIGIGASEIGLGQALGGMADAVRAWTGLSEGTNATPRTLLIVLEIRLPRTVLGLLVGAGLAVAGALMQGLFRNPLADPGLVGVSAGAALAAVATIVLGPWLIGPIARDVLPLAAFLGGAVTTSLLYAVATRRGRTSVATMLLGGIAIGAMAAALTGLLIYMSDDQQLRDLTFWSLGSLGGATWPKIAAAAPLIGLALAAIPFLARGLNGLALGEAEAHHLGIPVQTLTRSIVLLVASAVGASVAFTGMIGFVGIVVPHLLRITIGPDHRFLLPGSAFLGGALLVAADMVSRTVVAPAELPIGIITAIIGGPFFIWIVLRQRGVLDL